MNISAREKILLFITILGAILFVYWTFLLDPVLVSITKTNVKIEELQKEAKDFEVQIKNMAEKMGASAQEVIEGKEKVEIYPQQTQLTLVVDFIDKKFKWFGIALISMNQSTDKENLIFDLEFKSSSYQFLGFFNSLSQLKTVVAIDSVSAQRQDNKLVTKVRLSSPFRVVK